MLTGNKGEWSEVYALFKLLADKKLKAGDANLNVIKDLFYPLIRIIREEAHSSLNFSYLDNLVLISSQHQDKQQEVKIPIEEFARQAKFLLTKLQGKTPRTFALPEVENFLNSFNSTSLKAKSSTKSDIRLVIHDLNTGMQPTLGFSIKSQLGSAATLLNAGKTTNFIFKVTGKGLTKEEIEKINSIDGQAKIKRRLEAIYELGSKLEFINTESSIFENNLTLIDSSLPSILACCLEKFFTSKYSHLQDLVNVITASNPLNYNQANQHPFYAYKIKRFLTDVALGMMPSKTWTGELETTGGYLIIKKDGEQVCYHIYNRNQFEDYLFCNTKLETASSSRHNFGYLY